MKEAATALATILGVALAVGCGGTAADPPPAGLTPVPEESATGSSASVPTDTQVFYQSVEEMFRGRVSGLEVVQYPECGTALRIRGFTTSLLQNSEGASLSGCATQPLLVIDGKQVPQGSRLESALAGLRPNDIDRIDVLKDVSSTSIYGSQGAYGVVLITTKR